MKPYDISSKSRPYRISTDEEHSEYRRDLNEKRSLLKTAVKRRMIPLRTIKFLVLDIKAMEN